MQKSYSEITNKLKEIDWEPIAEKAWSVLQTTAADDLTQIPEEDREEYKAHVRDLSKLTILHMTADEEEREIIQREMGFVKLSMESMEARNSLFAYRKTVEVIGAILAATIAIAIAVA